MQACVCICIIMYNVIITLYYYYHYYVSTAFRILSAVLVTVHGTLEKLLPSCHDNVVIDGSVDWINEIIKN